jgi:imidazole glycerol-phosphate synthase subunit HisH
VSSDNVVLVDAGGTNIGSVRYALERLGIDARISDDANRIRDATHVILPGVGAAGPGMQRLRESGLVEVMRSLEQPVLGVCLGMQLLFEHSEEGDTACLGLIPGRVRRIESSGRLRVPHMGWNRLQRLREDRLLTGLPKNVYAYFVHSYAISSGASTLARGDPGLSLSANGRRKNFCGMQFHPERSGRVGALLLKNFLSL